MHIKAFYTQKFTNHMVLECNFYYYVLVLSLALISPHPLTEFQKSAHLFSTTFKSLCPFLFYGLKTTWSQ